MTTSEHEALRESYRRLRVAASAVVDEAVAAGDMENPLCGVEPHLIRQLRRELAHERQPHGLTFMSVS